VRIDPETYALIDRADTIQVGDSRFAIRGIITEQTSAGFNFLDEGRTIILPYKLVDQTGLTEFGSRSEYQIQVQTPNDTIAQEIQTTIRETYGEEVDVDLASDRIEQLGGIVDQLNQYTSIILIVTLILSLMVMTIATMTMSLQIKSAIAIMRILGITRGQTARMTIILLGGMFVVGALIGIGLAYR
jgi:putative ABC transport system permease protein